MGVALAGVGMTAPSYALRKHGCAGSAKKDNDPEEGCDFSLAVD